MKTVVTVLAVAALCIYAWAADNAVIAPQSAVSHKPQATTYGAEAITIPQMLSYQGKLTDTLGQPVPNNDYSVTFKLYTVPSGGSPFWNETQSVKTRAGLFSVLLGSVTPIGSVPGAGALYLGMAVAGGTELVPRLRIASAAYAYKADTANYALAAAGGDNAWVRSGSDSVLYTVHLLGIAKGGGANALLGPSSWSHVNFGFRCTTGLAGQDRIHIAIGGGRNNVVSGSYSTVAGGTSNTAPGEAASVGGGQTNSASAAYATVGGGYSGVAQGEYSVVGGGRADTARSHYGAVLSGYHNVAGDSATDTAATVAGGWSNSATGKFSSVGGGYCNRASDVYATVGGGNGDTASGRYSTVSGGIGNVASGDEATVAGGSHNDASLTDATVAGGEYNTASGYAAAVGGGNLNCASGNGSVVPGGYYDTASAYNSLAANSNSNAAYDNSAAFNGQTATASGQTRVGVLSKASGSFTIDHPLDHYGKILNHYFIEGPEMRNIYDGEAVLDASGRVVVTLPDYFDALNRGPRIQLTGVGSSDVYVAQEVTGNRFTIGGRPGTKVFWQVTGERQDVSAEATRRMMPVEQPKTGPLVGRMLDDDFLVGCMDQLVREGKAQGIDFRTAAGRQRYEKMKQLIEHR